MYVDERWKRERPLRDEKVREKPRVRGGSSSWVRWNAPNGDATGDL